MSKVIEITVAPDGQANVETKGFAGSRCRQASEFIEQALGRRITEQLTSEFYQATHESQQATRRGE